MLPGLWPASPGHGGSRSGLPEALVQVALGSSGFPSQGEKGRPGQLNFCEL